MACDVVALNTVTNCLSADGGIEYSWYVSAEYITAVTVSSGVITNFTMGTASKWKRLDYDKDGTSFFNETGQRTNRRLVYQQAALLKFAGKNAASKAVTDTAAACCALVFVHVLTTGERVVQGIEIDAAATGGFTTNKVEVTRLTPNSLSDTSANEARLEWNAGGQTRVLAPFTDLTDAEFAAL